MRRHVLAFALAVAALAVCCFWAPWVQGPGGFESDASLGFAPIWTKDFRYFPGARIDLRALATHIVIALLFPLLIGVGQVLRRPDA